MPGPGLHPASLLTLTQGAYQNSVNKVWRHMWDLFLPLVLLSTQALIVFLVSSGNRSKSTVCGVAWYSFSEQVKYCCKIKDNHTKNSVREAKAYSSMCSKIYHTDTKAAHVYTSARKQNPHVFTLNKTNGFQIKKLSKSNDQKCLVVSSVISLAFFVLKCSKQNGKLQFTLTTLSSQSRQMGVTALCVLDCKTEI